MARRKSKTKNSNFVDKPNKDFEVYKNGAFVGGLLGGMVGLFLGKRIILWIVGGAVAGGYINYEIHKEDNETISFKKFKES